MSTRRGPSHNEVLIVRKFSCFRWLAHHRAGDAGSEVTTRSIQQFLFLALCRKCAGEHEGCVGLATEENIYEINGGKVCRTRLIGSHLLQKILIALGLLSSSLTPPFPTCYPYAR